jgi:hypothetical protein
MKTARPSNLSAEEIARWRAEFESRGRDEEAQTATMLLGELFPGWQRPDPLEVGICGNWLERELLALGCSPGLAERICFANGQKIAADVDGDHWGVTLLSLADYQRGHWDEPGAQLSSRLFAVQMPQMIRRYGKPTPERIKRVQQLLREHGPLSPPPPPLFSN